MDNPELWKITVEERTKHNATFMQLGPINGTFLSGEQAKAFFLKSNLATNVLGQIWNLADINKDGKLDKLEFSIACFLIKKALTSPQGAAVIPNILPKSLTIEPSMASAPSIMPQPLMSTPIPMAVPNSGFPLIAPTVPATTPLFAANFPPVTAVPAPQPSLFPVSGAFGSTAPTTSTLINGAPKISPLVGGTSPMPIIAPNILPTTGSTILPSTSTPMAFMPATTTSPLAASTLNTTASPVPPPAGAVFTPLVAANQNLPNPISPIPQTSRSKYGQMFQSNDTNSTGFLNGQQVKTLLMQTGLSQPILAQIWNLADFDKDGKLSYEEFIIAMHLCDYARAGNTLPSTLPVDLQPQRSRASSAAVASTGAGLNPDMLAFGTTTMPTMGTGTGSQESSPTLKGKANAIGTFEDKRRENFDRGNAVLEAKRQMLREQEEREKREREEKERLENERKQKIKEEQEKRRLAEMEKQMERQRQIDMQREEERRKMMEQREQARNELIRQQRLEWEKQKKQELETQKLKLQELLSSLKARDKNLEYDLSVLNEKIGTYRTKISDNQNNLVDLNNKLDLTRKSHQVKQTEVESAEKELKDLTFSLNRLAQEKLILNEQLKNLNQDSPFAEEYRNDSMQLKLKQNALHQLKADLEAIESKMNSARTQLEIVKHELEVSKADEGEFRKENDRLNNLLDIKRNTLTGGFKSPTFGANNNNTMNNVNSNPSLVKTSMSNSNLRSATPKDNYDAFKDEIIKIQQTASTTTNKSLPTSPIGADPFGTSAFGDQANMKSSPSFPPNSSASPSKANYDVDWSSAFGTTTTTTSGFGSDPFAAAPAATNFDTNKPSNSFDPFSQLSNSTTTSPGSKKAANGTSDFDDSWFNNNNNKSNTLANDPFSAGNSKVANSTSFSAGFGADDNWAAAAATTTTNSTTNINNNNNQPAVGSPTKIANNANNFNNSGGADWAAFNDDSIKTSNSNGNVKSAVDFFNTSLPSPTQKTPSITKTPTMSPSNSSYSTAAASGSIIKYKAMYTFDASRDDELSVQDGDIVNVDLSIKTDEGWIWGECKGRTGVFPASFAVKLSDLESIQEEHTNHHFGNNFAIPSSTSHHQALMNATASTVPNTQIKNYYISIYPYASSEPGDLNFREYEIINVLSQNEDWFTGEIVGSGYGDQNPLRHGIFPSNFVIKFTLPVEHIGKYTIAIVTEPFAAQNGEIVLDPSLNQLVAIRKISPDNKWSFAETYDQNGKISKGWIPISASTALIQSNVPPIVLPNAIQTSSASSNAVNKSDLTGNSTGNNMNSNSDSSTVMSSFSLNNNTTPPAPLSSPPTTSPTNLNNNNSFDNNDSSLDAANAAPAIAVAAATASSSAPTSTGDDSAVVSRSNNDNNIVADSASASNEQNKPEVMKSKSSERVSVSSPVADQPAGGKQQPASNEPTTVGGNVVIDRVIALYDFNPTTSEAIGFPKDAIINILEKSGDWWYGEYNGKIGILPYNYVQSLGATNQTG